MNTRPSRGKTLIESLTRAQLTVYVAAILLASLGASLVGYRFLREQVRQHLNNLAQITAIESQPALVFDQDTAAKEVLQGIPVEEGVTRAELFDASGKLRASSVAVPDNFAGRMAGRLNGESGSAKVIADGHVIGEVRLQGGQEPLLRALFGLIGSDLLVVAFVGLLSAVVSRRNTRRIAEPLTQLRTIMRQAIEQRDFSQRAPVADIAEVNDLRVEFNALLDEIDSRDQTLHEQNALLRHLAMHDTLTGLPNRAMFEHALKHSVEACRKSGDAATLLYLDINSFKRINDKFGHAGGDRLLVEMARRLQQWLPPEAIAARLGGDEFVVLLSPRPQADTLSSAQAKDLMTGLQATLNQPVEIDDCRIRPAVSIGMATYPGSADNAEMLLRIADQAMYANKIAHHRAANVTAWAPLAESGTIAPGRSDH
ncbi:MAG: diguanylate cyclase [Rudaea sp.]